MKKRGLSHAGILGLCVFMLIFFLQVNGLPAQTTIKLKLGHQLSTNHPRHLASVKFADLVKERTGGRVQIDIYPAGTLGSEIEMGEALKIGTLDVSALGGPIFTNWVPQYAVFGLPFLFNSYKEAYAALDGPMGKKMEELALAKNFFILSHWDHGFRHITNSVRPIQTAADLKGLRLRTPEEFVNIETFKTLGAGVTPMPFGELYLALQQKVVDGQENPLGNIYHSKFYEVQKYLTLSGHIYANSILVFSKKSWDSLPNDVKTIMQKAGQEGRDLMRELIQKEETDLVKSLEKAGMVINRPSLDSFRSGVSPVYAKLEQRIGKDTINEMFKLLGRTR